MILCKIRVPCDISYTRNLRAGSGGVKRSPIWLKFVISHVDISENKWFNEEHDQKKLSKNGTP